MTYTKLSNSILTSTLWMEDAYTRLVWVTMLAMKDRHGEVMGSIPGLANIARVPVDACRAAIAKFLAPDPDSRTTEHEGRRIEAIAGGWLILNHAAYRDMDSDEDRRRKAAIRQQRMRDRRKAASRRDGVTNHSNLAMQISDADADADAERESGGEMQPPPPHEAEAEPTKEEKALRLLEELGAIIRRADESLTKEWKSATKGLSADQVKAVFMGASPGIRWPSDFRAARKSL